MSDGFEQQINILIVDDPAATPTPNAAPEDPCRLGQLEWNIALLSHQIAEVGYKYLGHKRAETVVRVLFGCDNPRPVVKAFKKIVARAEAERAAEAQAAKETEPTHKPAAAVTPTVPKPESPLEPGFPDLPDFLDRTNPAFLREKSLVQPPVRMRFTDVLRRNQGRYCRRR